jgi:hypothetical protein
VPFYSANPPGANLPPSLLVPVAMSEIAVFTGRS